MPRQAVVPLVLLASAISPLSAQTWHFRTLAGSTTGGGYADGPAAVARFSSPSGAAACGGSLFIADSGNHAIRRISADGEVTTWAGALAQPGSNDGDRLQARFRYPTGVAADSQCNLFVADRGNHTVRRISAAGSVITVAGTAGTPGVLDGTGSAARFNAPQDVAVHTDGRIWVADTGNNAIRRIGTDGRVQTLANTFSSPLGLGLDAAGNALIADYRNNRIARVTADGATSTVISHSSLFPADVAVDRGGTVYIANYSDQVIEKIDGGLVIVAGTKSRGGWRDGQGADARFDRPRGIAFDGESDRFIVADEFNCVIRAVTPAGNVTTLAGSAAAPAAHVDGVGSEARFQTAFDVDVDSSGVAYVTDATTIRRIAPDGTTTTIAGTPGESLHRDGSRTEARFRGVSGIAVEPAGSLVVIDGTDTVRRVTLSGDVVTIAGSPGQTGYRDDSGGNARFNYVVSIAVAPDGTIYAADAFNRAIRRISGETVTTLATSFDRFTPPMGGLDVDSAGNLYLWNENAPSVFRITPAGEITSLATDPSLINMANGLALAPDGTFYIGGFRLHSIYRLTPGSTAIEQFAGDDFAIGNQNGTAAETRFRIPARLDVAPDGRLFVCDGNRAVRVASPGAPPVIASFTARPAVARSGESVTLAWSTSGGTARIEPLIGEVAAEGQVTVAVTATTTYSLMVSNESGVVRADVTIVITGPRRRSTRPS